jgi:hypothetical protein
MMAAKITKRAVCVGINDYPGTFNDLSGCVNDANDWAELLRDEFAFGENVTLLTDADATKSNILSALGGLIAGARGGDVVVFTYSGHGTWVYDRGERDESDNRDEALCAHDEIILDDELRNVIRQIDRDAYLTVISDSCHSGSVTRAMLKRAYEKDKDAAENAPKPRYMPPDNEIDALRTEMVPIRRRAFYPESDMPEILLSGCNATEYSDDAYISGRYNGAMTAMAISLIKSEPERTYNEFHEKLRLLLPTPRYPQSPQLEGSDVNKGRVLFG